MCMDATVSCWSAWLDGRYVREQHGSTAECYDFDTAKARACRDDMT